MIDHGMQKDKVADYFLEKLQKEKFLCRVIKQFLRVTGPKQGIYACGGIVRDAARAILNGSEVNSADFDFVVEGFTVKSFAHILEQLKEACEEIEQVVHAGKSFPVWKVKIASQEEMVDFALTRTEHSFGERHRDFHVNADSVSVEDDSARRDFTVNALYVKLFLTEEGKLLGEVLDFHSGLKDIVQSNIRCVGVPEDRFREDPLRMLRAVRFSACFQEYSVDDETAETITRLAPSLVQTISRERNCRELFKMISANPMKALTLLEQFALMPEIIPQLSSFSWEERNKICDPAHVYPKARRRFLSGVVFCSVIVGYCRKRVSS